MTPVDVLLVEDNAGDAVLIRQVLAECGSDIKLHIARDGEQALQMLRSEHFQPSLIILDLNIPRVTGSALLEQWQPRDTPVVVFSSSLNEDERRHIMELGAREFIHKPTDIEEFTKAVQAIVHQWIQKQAYGCQA